MFAISAQISSEGGVAMYTSIDIDFDVFKELTIRRKNPEMTENEVLRDLFGIGQTKQARVESTATAQNGGAPWVWKGVTFPHGTELCAEYGGPKYFTKIGEGAKVEDKKRCKMPSPA